ncbi:hypothetical protein OROGR_016153 [Orobanche gracilis]
MRRSNKGQVAHSRGGACGLIATIPLILLEDVYSEGGMEG